MQANALVAEAEKKLSGGKGFLSGLFGWVSSHPWNYELHHKILSISHLRYILGWDAALSETASQN